jgi:hypothetical protein
MARTRLLSPEFFLDDKLASLPPLNRILFAGLWCLADRAGRLTDNPKKIKIQLLPYDQIDIEEALNLLASQRLIHRYVSGEQPCIQIVNFGRYQHPHHTEKPSSLPAPTKKDAKTTVETPLQNGATTQAAPCNTIAVTCSDTDTVTDTVKSVGARCKKPQRASPPPADEDWLETLKGKAAYEDIDVRREFLKAVEWCEVRGIILSRRRFINWLNRTDKPIKGGSNGGKRKSVVDEWAEERGVNLDGGLREGPQNHRGALPEPQALKRPA